MNENSSNKNKNVISSVEPNNEWSRKSLPVFPLAIRSREIRTGQEKEALLIDFVNPEAGDGDKISYSVVLTLNAAKNLKKVLDQFLTEDKHASNT